MAGRLEGKTALVMGAGSIGPGWGNGKATAALFAREGARVVCADINGAAAEETAEIIHGEGGEAYAVQVDATRDADVRRVMVETQSRFGRLNILDNNIGIAVVGGVVELGEEEWDRVLGINLKTCFLAMKHAIPLMVAQGGGAIVNISSIAGVRYTGVPYASYSATKAAMNHLTRTSAAEYAGRQVRINAVLPGLIKTPMVTTSVAASYAEAGLTEAHEVRDRQVPMGRQGEAWDVAEAALFLASDAARYITGIELVVDGGLTLKCA